MENKPSDQCVIIEGRCEDDINPAVLVINMLGFSAQPTLAVPVSEYLHAKALNKKCVSEHGILFIKTAKLRNRRLGCKAQQTQLHFSRKKLQMHDGK